MRARYEPGNTDKHEFICEHCGKTEQLTNREAFDQGWDYPPFLGEPGIVSPRNCGECTIEDTLWWAMALDHLRVDDLTFGQRAVLNRILDEALEESNEPPSP